MEPLSPLEMGLKEYAQRLDAIAAVYPRLPAILAYSVVHPNGVEAPMAPWRSLVGLAALFAAGLAMAVSARRLLRLGALRLGSAPAPLLRLSADLAQMAAFALGAFLAFAIMRPPHPAVPALLLATMQVVATLLLTDRLLRLLTAPADPAHRLLPLGDAAARALQRAAVTAVALAVVPLGVLDVLRALGIPHQADIALGLPITALPFLYLLWLVWSGRSAVARTLAEGLRLDSRSTAILSAWPALGSLYLLWLWTIVTRDAVQMVPGTGLRLLGSLLLALGLPLAALALARPLARFYRTDGRDDSPDDSPDFMREEGGEAEPPGAIEPPQVVRLTRAILLALVVLAVAGTAAIWEIGLGSGPASVPARLLLNLSVVLLLGYVAWSLVVRGVDRALDASRRTGPSTKAQRMATLLPLLRKALQVTLVAVVAMVALSSMGVEIAPLLAGAGVVGIAVGLGAQSIIADIFAGIFFLLEDAFHVGDYVEIGQLRGTVEGISLRSLKLRHHRGAVHTVPFGQIKALTNHSRDWVLMRLEFRVPAHTDLDQVKALVKQVGKQLAADPEIGPNIIEPLKSQGVRRVEDDALIIGVKFTAKPNEQFVIRREAYQRLIRSFIENGIALVGRGVVVRVEDPRAGGTQAIGLAAAQALHHAIDTPANSE
ncbi:mechanosensitive ion channel family protein [Azospirillum picis]|uniref:Small-conductance mechanosensitive channel n=1 Tax=Azospirillum picis TaxID=488438 RepID=A0ABU0MJD9_9PROT|nr:mechanosensitive ion channel family protein [Azospirillum picis]MBP2299780.1 small-conductance mechanosensitive channel [Azospirillum picis]MDQ0533576.1 small-conductance mechanosensitive channel [Azospirillum picis]